MTTDAYMKDPSPPESEAPDTGSRLPWLRRMALMNDYVRIPYANGSSFASQFLYREFNRRGYETVVVGPREPDARPEQLPPRYQLLPALPLLNAPGVYLPMPTPASLLELERQDFDLVLTQTCNALMDAGVWLRSRKGVPLIQVNTVHLPSVYNNILPDFLNESETVHKVMRASAVPFAERATAASFNDGDGLIVLSDGMRRYWENLGVTVPIHVIPRAIEPGIFDVPPGDDPFPAEATKGGRLLVACRHVREKEISRLLRILATHVFPENPDITLTLVGDGPDHEAFIREANELGIGERTFFLGERSQTDMPTFYGHADLFVYTSLSETYGQVISEALYCGLPVVAHADHMGVSDQIEHDKDGLLIEPGATPVAQRAGDIEFARGVLDLIGAPDRRRAMAEYARRRTRGRTQPANIIRRYEDAFEVAREHVRAFASSGPHPTSAAVAYGRWTGTHALTLALGLMRQRVKVNRNEAKAPTWTLDDDPN